MIRKVALSTALATGIALAALALWQMREALMLLLLALVISAGFWPAIRWLVGRGLPRPAAIAVLFLSAAAIVVAGLLLLGGQIGAELTLAADALPAWYDRERAILSVGSPWARTLAELLPSTTELTGALVGPDIGSMGGAALGLITQSTVVVVLLFSAVSLGFYWSQDQQRIERLWLSLLPLRWRTRARRIWSRVYTQLGIQTIAGAADVLLTTLGLLAVYWLAGVPGAATLALLGGLVQFIPLVGPVLAVLPGALVALSLGPTQGALAFVGAAGVVALVEFGVVNRILRAGAPVNPLLTIFVIMALVELGEPLLLLLSLPLAGALQAALQGILEDEPPPETVPDTRLHVLRERLASVDTRVGESAPGPDGSRLRDMLGRTRALLDEAVRTLPPPGAPG